MIYYQEPFVTLYQGHALDVLRELPPESVDCVLCSPPYWGLRSYKTEPIVWDNHSGCEHEWGDTIKRGRAGWEATPEGQKQYKPAESDAYQSQSNFCLKCHGWKGELGLEPTIELYISHLLQVFDEVKRILKKTGTCWVNIGDSYYGGGFGYEKDLSAEEFAKKYPKQGSNAGTCMDWKERKMVGDTKRGNLLPAKSLCLIPERFALGMVERGWILRNRIVWYKSNPMPESVKDRFTGTYEDVFFFTKSRKYWFEQQFEPHLEESLERYQHGFHRDKIAGDGYVMADAYTKVYGNPLGRNKRDVWEINTQPYPEAHFATFPEDLCKTPILSGCPAMICKKCGKARERIYERGDYQRHETEAFHLATHGQGANRSKHSPPLEVTDKGYSDCGCGAGWEPGVLLDPFCGSGTALAVAKSLGRKAIGIDVNRKYCDLCVKRISKVSIPMPLL